MATTQVSFFFFLHLVIQFFVAAIEPGDPEMDEVWEQSKPLLKELWELNLSTGRWRKCEMKGIVPEQLASHTAVMHPLQPGLMLIYGGTGAPFGITTSNTMVTCDLDTQHFRSVATTISHCRKALRPCKLTISNCSPDNYRKLASSLISALFSVS